MKKIALIATASVFAAMFSALAAGDDGHFVTRTTDKGCIFYAWQTPDPDNNKGYNAAFAAATVTWDGPCVKGEPISGQGTATYAMPSDSVFFDQKQSGKLVDGYKDGVWSIVSKLGKDGGYDMAFDPASWVMGCPAAEDEKGNCVPGGGAQTAAAEPSPEPTPTPEDKNAQDENDEDQTAEASEEVEGVNEISEGGVPTDRWVAARRTRDTAPKHVASHEVSQCVGTFWKMHAGTGHYVVYNKCDKDIRVGWCSSGFGGDCVAGKGQIATMEPMVGYASGLKREETPKYSACSKNIFPVYEGNELVAFSCE